MKLKKILMAFLLVFSTLAPLPVASVNAQSPPPPTGITVNNAVDNQTYTLYKIFDVTTTTDGGYSYTIPEGKKTFYKNSVNFTDLFTVDETPTGLAYVQPKEAATAQAITTWATANKDNLFAVDGPYTATGNQVSFQHDQPGYFIIINDSDNSLLVENFNGGYKTVIAKDVGPEWGDNTGGKIINGKTSYNVGEEISYQVTFERATNYKADGTKIYQYVLKDILPSGVSYTQDSMSVTVGGQPVEKLTLDVDGQTLTLTIPWTDNGQVGGEHLHDTPQTIKVTYKATVGGNAEEGESGEGNTNTAIIYPNSDRPENPEEDPNKKTVTFTSGEIQITKVDGQSKNTLSGAEFVLKKADDGNNNYLKVGENKTISGSNKGRSDMVTFLSNATDATRFVTNTEGQAIISGIEAGNYELIEVKAPDGYNLLTESKRITLEVSGAEGDQMIAIETIENNKGTMLPETGGIGTTIFYVVGLLLIGGSIIYILIKRRVDVA